MKAEGTVAEVLAGEARLALHHGDTREVLAAMAPESLDLVVTDPPFGIEHDSNYKGSEWTGQIIGDDAVDVSWLRDLARAMKPSTALYLFTRWDVEHAWCDGIRAAGLRIVQSIVWDRGTHGMGHILRKTWEAFVVIPMPRFKRRKTDESDLWRVEWSAARRDCDHAAQKPTKLFERAVELVTDVGAVVLDPFGGSGTTAEASLRLGRCVVIVERDADYAALARRRCEAVERNADWRAPPEQGALFGGEP